MESSNRNSKRYYINFWDSQGSLSGVMYAGLFFVRSSTVPNETAATLLVDQGQAGTSPSAQRHAHPDFPITVNWEAVDRLEAQRKDKSDDKIRTTGDIFTDKNSGPSTPNGHERSVRGPMVEITSPMGTTYINRDSFMSPAPYKFTKFEAATELSKAEATQEQTVMEETVAEETTTPKDAVPENSLEDKLTKEDTIQPKAVLDKATQVDPSMFAGNSLSRNNSTETIRPLRKSESISSMNFNNSEANLMVTAQVGRGNPKSLAVSDDLSTRVTQGSRCSSILPETIDDNTISEFNSDNTPTDLKNDGTKEATDLILKGRAAIGDSKYPFTIDKNTGKQYFSPSQINREIRAVQSAKQHTALQNLLEEKKKAESGKAPRPTSLSRPTSGLDFFGNQTEHPNTPLEHDAPPTETSRWSADSDLHPTISRTSTLKKRFSGISFISAAVMSPTSSSRPRAQISGPTSIPPNSPITPTTPVAPPPPPPPSTTSKPRILSIIPSLLKKSSKGKARESTTSSASAGNAASSAGAESIAKFQLTPLSGLIKQSYMDLNTLRTLKGNVVDNANSPTIPGTADASGDAAREAMGALLVGVDFDRIEANLKRFEDLYEAFLLYGDGTSGGPAEEVHLVAMICKRSDVERGGMKSDNSVPRVEPN